MSSGGIGGSVSDGYLLLRHVYSNWYVLDVLSRSLSWFSELVDMSWRRHLYEQNQPTTQRLLSE